MSLTIAYLAGGKLHFKQGQNPTQTIDSEFAQTVQDRILSTQRRNAWKTKQTSNPMADILPAHLFPQDQSGEAKPPVIFKAVSVCEAGKLLYTLATEEMAGIFSFDLVNNRESRLFHSADFAVQDLSFNSKHHEVACALMHQDSSAHIATMPIEGIRPRQITEGDSIDLAPRWIPGAGKALVYQSAGIARDRNGYLIDQGPYTVEKLDFEQGDISSLVADPKYDFLLPQVTADGTMYYIRRPYQPRRQRFSLLDTLRDLLLMPLRLARAVYEWLNMFTKFYAGKPLLKTGKPQIQANNQLILWGKRIDPVEMAKENEKFDDQDSPALVPRSWQLIRQLPGEDPQVLGKGVLSYDVGPDGSLVYTNGNAIYTITPGGVAKRLIKTPLIEQVAIINVEAGATDVC
jgi:hypothetical protein